MPILSSDIGSLPPRVKAYTLGLGASQTNTLLPLLKIKDEFEVFKEEVVSAQIDKLAVGLDVPTYPQFRDMNNMFFELLSGFEKDKDGYHRVEKIVDKGEGIPEIRIIKQESKEISEKSNLDYFKIKICITGPYTLSSLFKGSRTVIIQELGDALSNILRKSLFETKYGIVEHVSVDEPVLGFLNDQLLDYGSEGRETLRVSWEKIFRFASKFGASTSIHLHNTSDSLFWETDNLNYIGSHIGDPLYTSENTLERLYETDKKLIAPIALTQFDDLISNYYRDKGIREQLPELIGKTWIDIKSGKINPIRFLESKEKMEKYLKKQIKFFGEENIAYASPECGLSSFPGYKYTLKYLKRVSNVVNEFSPHSRKY
jgi:5-methyltetrahydropteroyltriglutamate--homocysteine methyltransferase